MVNKKEYTFATRLVPPPPVCYTAKNLVDKWCQETPSDFKCFKHTFDQLKEGRADAPQNKPKTKQLFPQSFSAPR